ncbi:MAG: hypothetical protein EOQ55_27230 [Mesorhizobium sp.]|uniref:hypothetical protein n=1 Tax=Mesorhizobium sp. TaxID=1871066 RepID=UPI000FE8F1BE|nr:hypothetical protein [Mesorhizobium sp.]RWG12248.1 MAG: hypothetical protein EOQ55_27230 [Mesorhizobium sp.]
MSQRRRHTGRVKVDFAQIEALAASELATSALAAAMGCDWTLTRHSALYRCRDGLYTLCLVWHGPNRETLTTTMRGLQLEVA